MPPTSAATQVAELVRVLALGWKNLAAYPAGHPALTGSLQLIEQRLTELRGPAGEVVFGIAADGIIYGDEKFDSAYAQKFANALYARGVAVVRFASETNAADIESFLQALGVGSTGQERQPLWDELTQAGVMNIHLTPVDYSDVKITDTLDAIVPEKHDAAWLWEEIVRALVADREISSHARMILSHEVRTVDDLAALILRYIDVSSLPASKFDPDATFGVKFAAAHDAEAAEAVATEVADAIGFSVAGTTGEKRKVALQQVVQLLRVLPEGMRATVLRSVLRTLASDEASGAALRDFASEMPQDEVLEALRHLSSLSKLSTHALALLQSLTVIEKPVTQAQAIPANVLTELVELFGEDDIDRFNPPDHQALLEDVAVQVPPLPRAAAELSTALGDRMESVAPEAVDRHVARTLLELASSGLARDPGALLMRVVALIKSQLTNRQFEDALEAIRQLQTLAITADTPELLKAAHDAYERLASAELIQALITSMLSAPPEMMSNIHELIDALGTAATRSLLTALAEESNRSRRRKLFDFVASLGSVIVPEVVALLNDSRWYVVRNMIALLRAVEDRSAMPVLHRLARHPDLRVRLEAIKALLALDPNVPRALLEDVVNASDPKLAETAIALVGSYGIKEGVDPLLHVLSDRDMFGTRKNIRVRAIRALGELGEPRALSALDRFFTDSMLPWPHRDERIAAYESLGSYPPEARAKFIDRGLRSRDAAVREICRKLSHG